MQYSDNDTSKRNISIEKPLNNPPQSPKILKVNIPKYDKAITGFSPSVIPKNNLAPPQREQSQSRDKKAASSSKQIYIMKPLEAGRNDRSIEKIPRKIQPKYQILLGILSFK
jgi:hypothetical protein